MDQLKRQNEENLEKLISQTFDTLLAEELDEDNSKKAMTCLKNLYSIKETYYKDKSEENRLKEIELEHKKNERMDKLHMHDVEFEFKKQELITKTDDQNHKIESESKQQKAQRRKDYINTGLFIAEHLLSIALILQFEKVDIITSKAFAWIKRGRP